MSDMINDDDSAGETDILPTVIFNDPVRSFCSFCFEIIVEYKFSIMMFFVLAIKEKRDRHN